VLHDNPWTQLSEHDVIRPDGQPGTYWVTHFHNRACGIVPFEVRDGVPGVWMVGQTRYALGQYSWELPEGGVPESEDMEAAARRELKEETGLSADRLTPLFDMHTSNSVTDEWARVYLATGLTHGEAAPEGTEDITRMFVPLADALAAINAGRITDSITVAALFRVELMRVNGKLPGGVGSNKSA
jgi:8-oxo-dGTP pyrophosphatase MutT (NUDIX family)